MTWTTPRTWVLDEIPSEATLNSHIRDQYRSLMHNVNYETATLDVTNTASDTALYAPTIPANEMGTGGFVEAVVAGDFLHNTIDTLVWRIYWGPGVPLVLHSNDATVLATHATRGPYELRVYIANKGLTNAQVVWATLNIWNPSISTGVIGTGNFTNASNQSFQGIMLNTASADTTQACPLSINVQWGAASASNSIRRLIARTLVGQN